MRQQRISNVRATAVRPSPVRIAPPRLDTKRDLERVERPRSASSEATGKEAFGRAAGGSPVVSMLFAPGDRPGADQVRALAAVNPAFRVSFDPGEDAAPLTSSPPERWLEVLANGLPFDIQGLAPGASQPLFPDTHQYALSNLNAGELEAISLRPALAISSGRILPVLRSLAWLAAMLTELPGVCAVGWHSARALSAPDHFRGSVLRWVSGGAFPGLGLTALVPTPDGALKSEGLALFTGQELRLAPELVRDRAAGARLALRLLHWTVEHGRLQEPTRLPGPSGEPLLLEPLENGRLVNVSCG